MAGSGVFPAILDIAVHHTLRILPHYQVDGMHNCTLYYDLDRLRNKTAFPNPSHSTRAKPARGGPARRRSQGRTAVATHRTSLVPPSDPNRAVKEGRLHGHMPNPIPHAHSPTPTPPPYTVPHTGPPLYTRPPHAAQQCSVHGLGPADSSREGWRTLPYTLPAPLYPTECDTLSCACEFVCARATWCHVLVWT